MKGYALVASFLIYLVMFPNVTDAATSTGDGNRMITEATIKGSVDALVAKHGEAARPRAGHGVRQVAGLWQAEDGDEKVFAAFVAENFLPEGPDLENTLARFESVQEQIYGHANEVQRWLKHWTELDLGPLLPVDKLFASWDTTAHVTDDMFSNKLAFVVLLNFPVTNLADRLKTGASWSRRQWAEVRLAARYATRVPASVNQEIAKAQSDGDLYIAEYNIWMHHLLHTDGKRPFRSGLKLISHWNLRDELKGNYADPEAQIKQRMIAKVMERIVLQEIPACVIDNPRMDWCPETNEVKPAPASDIEPDAPAARPGAVVATTTKPEPEPLTRYKVLLGTFLAARKADPYCPSMPTLLARRFEQDRELPEDRVRHELESVMGSPVLPQVAKLIQQRLGRPLEPYDIWYNGFLARGKHKEADLDAMTTKKYPNLAAFRGDLQRILTDLDFTAERAKYLSESVEVDPSRGAGHAMGALRREDKPHLRTRFGAKGGGMDYKGYNIAVHEFGHNVEQRFSMNHVDRYLLQGVPNTAFTEAIAFVFQARDLELLGLGKPDAEAERLRVLNDFWSTYEISGPATVDILVWHWMYDHPDARPAELRDAVVKISRDVWNKYYAPIFGSKDCVLLGIYSHMISMSNYLPDYPIGHMIAFQIEEQIRGAKSLGAEIERMATFGSVSPDLWMVHATGKPVSADALLRATEHALTQK